MTTLKIFETRLVRVPYSHFHGVRDMEEWESAVYKYRRELSALFGPNWTPIGPEYEENKIEGCVEYTFQRTYDVPARTSSSVE